MQHAMQLAKERNITYINGLVKLHILTASVITFSCGVLTARF